VRDLRLDHDIIDGVALGKGNGLLA
jgi:hypothetical protein